MGRHPERPRRSPSLHSEELPSGHRPRSRRRGRLLILKRIHALCKHHPFQQNPPKKLSPDRSRCFQLPEKQKRFGRRALPVMVFINWGGFFAGYGNSRYLGPEYFMDKDVVLVTFDYRLGVMGFLSTDDDSAPGNWALKDQVAALQWVQLNIGGFGGDGDKVTIFGQSAGGVSVHYHMLSPQSRGLFHAAISQSSAALVVWGRPRNELQAMIARTQAKVVGCDGEADSKTMVECLRKIDAKSLVDSADKFKVGGLKFWTIFECFFLVF